MRPGELWPKEREFLFQAIVEKKPAIVLETGTGGGGGSTHQIALALKQNTTGHLHTCETDKSSFLQANTMYSGWNQITCWNKTSKELINTLITSSIPDFIFFDGPEDPQVALDDLKILEPHIKPGTWFGMHDWDVVGVRADPSNSTKSTLLRPYIETSKNWKILRSLTAPVSVGIVLAEYQPEPSIT